MGLLLDGLIIAAYFAMIVWIGLRMGRRENTFLDFALGGRRLPWWAVMASIIAAETSAATFLGAPGEGYENHNLAYVQLIAGLILGRVLVGFIFLKPYYAFKVYTVYDYLGIRFGPATKNCVSALFLFMRTLASGSRLFVPALVMVLAWQMLRRGSATAGFHTPDSLGQYFIAIVLMTALTCVYTAVGGIKAVIWTDVVQATLMVCSAAIALVSLLYHVGGNSWNLLQGFHAVGNALPQMKHLNGYLITGLEPASVEKYRVANNLRDMSGWRYITMILASPYTIFSALIASTMINLAAFGTDQDMVQRLLTAESYKKSRQSLVTAAVMDFPIAAAFTFIGILLIVYYQQDPTWKPRENANVFGAYILNVMPAGVRGFVLAGVFATAMGSLSAALNALATSATNDWYIPYFAKHRPAAHHVAAARWFTAIFALLMVGIAGFFAFAVVRDPGVRIIPVVLGIAGFISGPMLGVFLVGICTRSRGSDRGNLFAITIGLATTIYLGGVHVDLLNLLGLGRFAHPAPIKIAFTWFAAIGATVVFIIALLFKTPQAVLDQMDEVMSKIENQM